MFLTIPDAVKTSDGGGEGALWVPFITTLIPFMRVPQNLINHLSKAPPFNTITLGLGFQHMNCGETTTQSIAVTNNIWQ